MHKQQHTYDHDHDHDDEGHCLPVTGQDDVGEFHQHGIRFQFPSDWKLTEESNDEQTTISVQSDGTSFWTLISFKSRPDPDAVLETVVAAFEQDYEEVDVASAIDSVGGLPSLGRDLDFVCYDLVNSATVRAFQTSDQTIMILYQGTDHELKTTGPRLRAITDSLICDDEESDSIS